MRAYTVQLRRGYLAELIAPRLAALGLQLIGEQTYLDATLRGECTRAQARLIAAHVAVKSVTPSGRVESQIL